MEVKILAFGQIVEIIGQSELDFLAVYSTNEVYNKLISEYPELAKITFAMAVNKVLINENSNLKDGDIVALMPPFSGG